MAKRRKMEAQHSKAILATAAIALFALAFTPSAVLAKSYPTPTGMTFYMAGNEFNPSNGQLGTFTLALDSSACQSSLTFYNVQGALVKASACGTFTDTFYGINSGVVAGWKYDTSTNKTQMKVLGVGFEVDVGLVTSGSAPNANVYQAVIHIPGQQDVRLVGSAALQITFSYP